MLTQATNPRSATPVEIRQAASRVEIDTREASDVKSALAEAGRIAGPGGLVVVTGSIYIVGEAMLALGKSI